ncbi:hypothetical protein EDD17DRAFT_1628719 [Pisolithus thermaeus]|nr:hypothetical protein EDD17DRAFT_1628719 [Pisolithus thermaeus]
MTFLSRTAGRPLWFQISRLTIAKSSNYGISLEYSWHIMFDRQVQAENGTIRCYASNKDILPPTSMMAPSPSTIVGHLTNPEATVALLVRIVQHPYDDLPLRISV